MYSFRNDRREHYYDAWARHGDNKYAIKNSLKKHYHYNDDEAWAVINEFDPLPNANGVATLKENETKEYMVASLFGDVVLTGQAARDFVANADKLGIHRSAYRLFVEVLP